MNTQGKDICMMCYWGRIHDDMLETCIKTFREHNTDALLHVYTDDIPGITDYDVSWIKVPAEKVKGRRALCKIELLQELVTEQTEQTRIVVADVDLYFLGDVFTAFAENFDLGLTTRFYDYGWPINAGVFFVKTGPNMRRFMDFRLDNLIDPSWDKYRAFEEAARYHPDFPKKCPDWFIDQDFLCAVWANRIEVENLFNMKIVDVGHRYNYCPDACSQGYDVALAQLKEAYDGGKTVVLHLKSKLKYALYEGWLPDAVISGKGTSWNWMLDGQAKD